MFNNLFPENRAVYEIKQKKNYTAGHAIWVIQGDSVARGPKLLSIRNYVIEIMT